MSAVSGMSGMSKVTAPDGTVVVRENSAEVVFPSMDKVFYNPVQDVAVLRLQSEDFCVGALGKLDKEKHISVEDFRLLKQGERYEVRGMKILEALAASGLRSIRFAKEISGISRVVANDLSTFAADSIKQNVIRNGVEDIVYPNCDDATILMYQNKRRSEMFNAIDLDPYGSPVKFLDAAVQSVSDGGLLLVTCTDMAILCGNTPEKCRASYGSTPFKTKSCHEWALRIVLHTLESAANRYGRYIQPLLSASIDFYCRLFVRVYTGQAQCKMSARQNQTKISNAYLCSYCETTWLQPVMRLMRGLPTPHFRFPVGPPVTEKCCHCGSSLHFGGPFWTAPIHDKIFVERLLKSIQGESSEEDAKSDFHTKSRMIGMLSTIAEELDDCPGFFCIDRLAGSMKTRVPKFIDFRSAILNAGYQVSISHACPTAVKTSAPANVVWDLMRCFEMDNPASRERLEQDPVANSAALMLLSRVPQVKANFERREDANPDSRKLGLKRFPENPAANWGPKSRAKTGTLGKSVEQEKSKKNQGKRTQNKHSSETSDEGQEDLKRLKTLDAPIVIEDEKRTVSE
ncbi:unnamed protein product [Notodromas monacha]|uniref:tRNA (guanine(26)-N(2))-dimethyltransferase n=1 Tax=Notodromas monacha TaxID=399045 RepID=A0A7R9BI88_9CRUS|nr:unnamed protein product [Notodromas monacha]CAG0914613.1 unnamed protein product [Notodromas monacha]